jgi:hypothetical protein
VSDAGTPAYAGVGSRSTPDDVLAEMKELAGRFARAGWVMRTGASPGADQAFYRGASSAGGAIELYLPWPSFAAQVRAADSGNHTFVLPEPRQAAFELGEHHHPRWSSLSARLQRLRARDVHAVLGSDLDSPVALIVCWTPDGGTNGRSTRSGGTGQALRVAAAHGIPVANLARPAQARSVLARHFGD